MEFKQLLALYRAGKLPAAERAAFEEMLHNEEWAPELARLIDGELATVEPVDTPETQEFLYHRFTEQYLRKRTGRTPVLRLRWVRYAAAVLIMAGSAGLGIFVFSSKNSPEKAAPASVAAKAAKGLLQLVNQADTVATVTLQDGSLVAVYPGASLAYPPQFGPGKREVYLEGEAFFNVSRDTARPFYVFNHNIVTQVLGTSFGVRWKNGQIEVAVKTGKVAVYENKDQLRLNASEQRSNGVIITPNQRVTYYEAERHFVTSIVEEPRPVQEKTDRPSPIPTFNYNETALARILSDLEKAYGLEIEVENAALKSCPFTGDLSGQHLFHQLEGICVVFNASYEIKGTRILLKGGKRCN